MQIWPSWSGLHRTHGLCCPTPTRRRISAECGCGIFIIFNNNNYYYPHFIWDGFFLLREGGVEKKGERRK